MRAVFFGTPDIAATILVYLVKKGVDVVAVITKPDRPRGRSKTPLPPPVKVIAETHGLPVFQPEKASAPEFKETLENFNADFFLVAAYSEILKDHVLRMPKVAAINVHASLLPKYRGAAPINRCIMEGETESGVTIMEMVPELDAGDMLAVAKTPISETMTAGELTEELAKIGSDALWKVLQAYEKGEVKPIAQDAAASTYAKKVKPEDGLVDWKNDSISIHNQVRGVTPNPGGWCWVNVRGDRKRLRLKKTLPEQGLSGEPGQLLDKKTLIVACGKGALNLLEVQLEGKKAMPGGDFLRGIANANFSFVV